MKKIYTRGEFFKVMERIAALQRNEAAKDCMYYALHLLRSRDFNEFEATKNLVIGDILVEDIGGEDE